MTKMSRKIYDLLGILRYLMPCFIISWPDAWEPSQRGLGYWAAAMVNALLYY